VVFEPVAATDLDAHLAGLNRSFTNWGARDRLAWVLRPFGGQPHDIFAMRESGDLVAGSIVSYRVIATGTRTEPVAVMTGSWTDPALRGRGLFSAMIDHSAALARESGAVALLAFVTSDNASRRRLEAAGSQLIPSWYVSTPAVDGETWAEVVDVDGALRELDSVRTAAGRETTRFAYPDIDDLRWQLIGRSPDVRVVESATGVLAVVEQAGATLRVLASTDATAGPWLPGIEDRFSYTTSPPDAAVASANGVRVTDGYLTVLALSEAWQVPPTWFVESGDRI